MSKSVAPEPSPFVLALDIGTSSIRAALFDERGRELDATESRLVRSLSTTIEGGAEDDAESSIEQVARTIDEALARTTDPHTRIDVVAVSCFWHSLVGTDRAGQPLTPVFGWADTRAARAAEELRQRFDENGSHARTGCRFHPSYWPAKLLWLSQDHPDRYRKVVRWMSFGDLLALRLFGELKTSVSMASGTGLLDEHRCAWDQELLAIPGVTEDQLPAVAARGEAFTGLTGRYAERWPQLKNARWFPAIGDGAANNIGEGCVTRKKIALMVGTSGAMRVLWGGTPPTVLAPELWCYRADHSRILVGGALSDGGGLYSWMSGTLALERAGHDRLAIEDALGKMGPDAHGLTVLPFWAGERSTGWSASARGAILGLTMHTRPIEILRAGMEAIAYRFALIGDALFRVAPEAETVASGGALRASPIWAQIIADALGRPLRLSGVREASSRGAVLLALEMAGKIKSIEDTPTPLSQTYEPDATRHARYRAGLERQQVIYERLIADQEVARRIGDAAREG